MSGVLDVLKRTGVLWWRCWPMLIAIYLIGWLARYWLIELAVAVTVRFGGLWGLLIMPVAVLARLVTYVVMFWTLGRAQSADHTGAVPVEPFLDVVLRSILPVFTLFAVWHLVLEDYRTYVSESNVAFVLSDRSDKMSVTQLVNYLEGSGWQLYLTVGVAFLARMALTKFKVKLPRGTQFLTLYFEALWVWLLGQAASQRLIGSPTWFAQRRVVHWYLEQKEHLFARLGVFADIWEVPAKTVGLLVPAVLLALTWIAIAGTIYAVQNSASWSEVSRGILGKQGERISRGAGRAYTGFQGQWAQLPRVVRSRGSELFHSLLGILDTLADTIRLVLRSGPVVVSFYVMAFTALVALDPNGAYFNGDISDGHLWRLVATVVGPHEWEWWRVYRDIIRTAINAVIDPLRITFVAAMYWHCIHLRKAAEEVTAP